MTEFKITPAFSEDVQAVRNAGENVINHYAAAETAEFDTLRTAMAFISEHEQIVSLMQTYKALVAKDIDDINAMIAEAERVDEELLNSFIK